jgi:hypothetical protein
MVLHREQLGWIPSHLTFFFRHTVQARVTLIRLWTLLAGGIVVLGRVDNELTVVDIATGINTTTQL